MIFKKRYWHVYRKVGTSTIYARCHCGFEYSCSSILLPEFKISFKKFYKYCPNCGRKYKTDRYLADKRYFK